MNDPRYIGDGVYVDFNGFHVELRVNDHRDPLAVALEDTVAAQLVAYIFEKFPAVKAQMRPEVIDPGLDNWNTEQMQREEKRLLGVLGASYVPDPRD